MQVNVTVSIGHGLSTSDCNWAPETEGEYYQLSRTEQVVNSADIDLQFKTDSSV